MMKKAHAVERTAIDKELAKPKGQYTLLNWPPSRGPMPKEMRENSRAAPGELTIEILPEDAPPLIKRGEKTYEFTCTAHIATLATLSLDQAHQLIFAYDKNGRCGLLLGAEDDFLPRPKPGWKATPLKGKRMKTGVPPTVVVDLDYPLSCIARVTISPFELYGTEQSFGHILWQISRAYKQIYKQWKKFGIWGHAITDLQIEGLEATADGRIEVHIGS